MYDFDKGQLAIIEQTAWTVAEKVAIEMNKQVALQIQLHASECLTKKKVAEIETWPTQAKQFSRGFVAGAMVIVALLGGTIGAVFTRIIDNLFKGFPS